MGELETRVARLEEALAEERRRARTWRFGAAIVVIGLAVLGPALGYAGKKKTQVLVAGDDGTEAVLTSRGLVFRDQTADRFTIDVGPDFSTLSVRNAGGNPVWEVASDASRGTGMRLFSADGTLKVEVAEQLLDSGSGVRLYDSEGHPRATFYAEKRGGEFGLELTDQDRQPRVDIYALDNGVSVARLADHDAAAFAEISILPEADALSRYTGMTPETREHTVLVPMVYMYDRSGTQTLLTPVTPE